jgi:hypothetical protein
MHKGSCRCGAPHLDGIGIMMGTFDTPTNVKLARHVFAADKGDCCDVADRVPQSLQ